METVRKMVLAVCVWGLAGTVAASDARTHGWVERATIEPWGVTVKAKLDTGALTSSMHALDIERFEREGGDWVRFVVEVKDERTGETVSRSFEREVYRTVRIRGAGGRDERVVVRMKLCVGDRLLEEQFGLTDRGRMLYPVLLGRRTLAHLGPVDALETFMQEPDCPRIE